MDQIELSFVYSGMFDSNYETCVGCSSSLLWYVHKYNHVILKHGRTCWEGGVLWPSNRLYRSLCLRASTCKHSLVINTSIEHSNSFQIPNLQLSHLNVCRLWLYITKAIRTPSSLASQWMMLSFQTLISFWTTLRSPSGSSIRQLQQDDRNKINIFLVECRLLVRTRKGMLDNNISGT